MIHLLPLHLLDDILFRLELQSLATMRCINLSMRSHISHPNFESEYFSRFGSSLFHLSSYVIQLVYCQNLVSTCDSKSHGKEVHLRGGQCYQRCCIFSSCSGLLLLYVNGLFVANPLTKRFRFVDHSGSELLPEIVKGNDKYFRYEHEEDMCVGFAVNRTTERFKIVCILEKDMAYRFEISDGESWRLSDATITPSSKSDLMKRMKPVYLDGTLYWLRNDGSIIAFNPETDQACFIPSQFHQEPNMKLFFASDNKINRLALLSGTKESIAVYTLLESSKWALTRQIKNVSMEGSEFQDWSVVAYNGKRLVVREQIISRSGVVHAHDMEANSWGVLGSTRPWTNSVRDFYEYTPSMFSIDDEDEQKEVNATPRDESISYLTAIMELINTTK